MVTLAFPRLDLQPLPWFILNSQGLDPAKQRFGGYHHFSGYVGKEVFLSVPLLRGFVIILQFLQKKKKFQYYYDTFSQEFPNQHIFSILKVILIFFNREDFLLKRKLNPSLFNGFSKKLSFSVFNQRVQPAGWAGGGEGHRRILPKEKA